MWTESILNMNKDRDKYERNNSSWLYLSAGFESQWNVGVLPQRHDISNQHYHALRQQLTTPISCKLSRNCNPLPLKETVFFLCMMQIIQEN